MKHKNNEVGMKLLFKTSTNMDLKTMTNIYVKFYDYYTMSSFRGVACRTK